MKKTYYKIRPIQDKAYCVVGEFEFKGGAVSDWLEGMNVGEELAVSLIEMTEDEFEAMPEYEG